MRAVNISRRQFLKSTGIVGGGLVIGFSLSGCSSSVLPIAPLEGGFVPNAFLQLGADNSIRFYCPRDEMGQGVMTGLLTLIAEELDVAPHHFDLDLPAYTATTIILKWACRVLVAVMPCGHTTIT